MKMVLNIVGENLDPALVSTVLGGEPFRAGKKGQPLTAADDRGHATSAPALAGFWQRCVSFKPSAALDSVIEGLLAGLTKDAAIWQRLSSQFRTEISLHGVLPHLRHSDIFSAGTLGLLQKRGLQLHLSKSSPRRARTAHAPAACPHCSALV